MGVIKAMSTSVKGEFAEQWLEAFSSEGFSEGLLLKRGSKMTGKGSANVKGSGEIISDNSVIIVNDGEAAISTENGKIIEVFQEPGESRFHSMASSGVFSGGGLSAVAKNIWGRFGFGGDIHTIHRIYYVNTKEIMDLQFDVSGGFPIHIVDSNLNMDLDVTAEMSGCYSIRVTDPKTFFEKVSRSPQGTVTTDMLVKQMNAEALSVLQMSVSEIYSEGGRPSALPAITKMVSDAFEKNMSAKWEELRGISVVSMAISHLALSPKDQALVTEAQRINMYTDPIYAAAALAASQADAMKLAAANKGRIGNH